MSRIESRNGRTWADFGPHALVVKRTWRKAVHVAYTDVRNARSADLGGLRLLLHNGERIRINLQNFEPRKASAVLANLGEHGIEVERSTLGLGGYPR